MSFTRNIARIVIDSSYARSDESFDSQESNDEELVSLLSEKQPFSPASSTSSVEWTPVSSTPPSRKMSLMVRLAAIGGLLLCGVMLGSVRGIVDEFGQGPQPPACDPYDSYGRLNISTEPSRVQWIPAREQPDCPVVDWMAKIQSASQGLTLADKSIEFARGRTIFLVGDSVDRGHLHHLCAQLSGELSMIGADHPLSPPYPSGQELPPEGYVSWLDGSRSWPSYDQSRPWTCYVRSVDLLLLNTFHYGFEDADSWIEQHIHHYPPALLEDRLDQIGIPLLDGLAKSMNRSAVPDIVSLTAGFWSILRQAKRDEALLNATMEAGTSEEEAEARLGKSRTMPDDLARWYARRAEQVLHHVGSLWSSAPQKPLILWRTLHRTQKWADIPSTRVAALDQITRAVVRDVRGSQGSPGGDPFDESMDLGRRLVLNTWGDKIDGAQYERGLFVDAIHPGPELSYLYGNMLLAQLRDKVGVRRG